MQAMTWLTSALMITQTASAQAPKATAPDLPSHPEMLPAKALPVHQDHLESRAAPGSANLAARYNKCLDVPSGQFQNGRSLQIWDCDTNNANQAWQLDGNMLRTANNKCLDVPNGNAYLGAPLQLWDCNPDNRNQWFEAAGNFLRKKNSNFCLDVRDGHYNNGNSVQLWACDYNVGGNQIFGMGQPAAPAVSNPSSFLGYATISWDAFVKLHPECSPWTQPFHDAAYANGLIPTLLGAVAMVEAGCAERPNNGFGLFQFMSEAAWQSVNPGKDKENGWDAAWGAARYLRSLLDQEHQNLDNTLRAYNGPIGQGGDPAYQQNIRLFLSGGSPWG